MSINVGSNHLYTYEQIVSHLADTALGERLMHDRVVRILPGQTLDSNQIIGAPRTMAQVTFNEDDATITTDTSIAAVPIESIYDADVDGVLMGGEVVPIAEVHTAVNDVLEAKGLIE